MTYDASKIERGQPRNAGQFRTPSNLNPEASLPGGPADLSFQKPKSGDTIRFGDGELAVKSFDGETAVLVNEDGDLRLASDRELHRAQLISAVSDKLMELTPEQDAHLAGVYHQGIEGAWGDPKTLAWFEVRRIEQHEAAVASQQGLDSSDTAVVNPLRGQAEAVYDNAFFAAARVLQSDERYVAMSAAHDAAVALAYRDHIDSERYTGFTQEAYDVMTRPWRTVFGPVHPDDVAEPASWASRPICTRPAPHTVEDCPGHCTLIPDTEADGSPAWDEE